MPYSDKNAITVYLLVRRIGTCPWSADEKE
jgi:hypothetical protein